MPKDAISSQQVDFILPAVDMPKKWTYGTTRNAESYRTFPRSSLTSAQNRWASSRRNRASPAGGSCQALSRAQHVKPPHAKHRRSLPVCWGTKCCASGAMRKTSGNDIRLLSNRCRLARRVSCIQRRKSPKVAVVSM